MASVSDHKHRTDGSHPHDMKLLTAVWQPIRQVVGQGNQIVLVGVDGHWGFGPGIVVCFSIMQSGSMQFVLSGGHPGSGRLVVAVKHGQGGPAGQAP